VYDINNDIAGAIWNLSSGNIRTPKVVEDMKNCPGFFSVLQQISAFLQPTQQESSSGIYLVLYEPQLPLPYKGVANEYTIALQNQSLIKLDQDTLAAKNRALPPPKF
jgi:hypothetical protein